MNLIFVFTILWYEYLRLFPIVYDMSSIRNIRYIVVYSLAITTSLAMISSLLCNALTSIRLCPFIGDGCKCAS